VFRKTASTHKQTVAHASNTEAAIVFPCSVPRAGMRASPPNGLADAREAVVHDTVAAAGVDGLASGADGEFAGGADMGSVSAG
jgi:hypothetical protein